MENKRKPWIKLTPQEIQNLTNCQCTDCKFYPKSNGTSGKMQPCDYIFMVGHSRGCDPRDCVKEGKFGGKTYDLSKYLFDNREDKALTDEEIGELCNRYNDRCRTLFKGMKNIDNFMVKARVVGLI